MIRFLHAADLHLDRPFEGLTRLPESLHERAARSTFIALHRLVDAALHERADFLLISGDLFDNSHRSIKAQHAFVKEMWRLQSALIPVYLVYGNHDFVNETWNQLGLPDNVHVFPETPGCFTLTCANGQVVHVYGFSYHQKWVKENMAAQYRKSGTADFHIALLHGEEKSGIDDGHYAPFTLTDLETAGFDYWALGHIHKRQQLPVSVPAWYPGDLQGLSFKDSELGLKGASVVHLTQHHAEVRFLPTSDIEWIHADRCFGQIETADQLTESLHAFKEDEREKHHGVFVRLNSTFEQNGLPQQTLEKLFREVIETLNEDEEQHSDFVWLELGTFDVHGDWNIEEIMNSPHFAGDLFRLIEQPDSVDEAAAMLYSHHLGRRFLPPLSSEDQQQIRHASEQLLADVLLKETQNGSIDNEA